MHKYHRKQKRLFMVVIVHNNSNYKRTQRVDLKGTSQETETETVKGCEIFQEIVIFRDVATIFKSSHNINMSLLSGDCSYECYSVNPLTGSPCMCRRSPRLLSNGYYILTEDSLVFDDEGNITLTPSKTTVTYKENLVRIFRRRRRGRRSLVSLFDMTEPSNSWLNSSMFSNLDSPIAESSWIDGNSEFNSNCSFNDDNSAVPSPSHKPWLSKEHLSTFATECCYSKEQFSQSSEGLLDIPPQSPFLSQKCCSYDTSARHSDLAIIKILFIILSICLCFAAFSRWLLGGLMIALLIFVLLFTSFILTKSAFEGYVRSQKTRAEDITSKNE
ncbi:transmembrane protein 71 isoform X2 [Acipenser ruthenus]|uniref:transmembrane protein 71 isoform X2 n=1 Tax=Acipenser ruthenus TaxID=7906 RepID=UPI00145B9AC5|nr:transmembrane protein 71 isoform X2 [Acipenser ruthenus]